MKDRPTYYRMNYQEKKINNRHITLKLLTTCEIVSILQQCSTDSTLVTFQLPLPPVICCDINEEIDYQRDLIIIIIIIYLSCMKHESYK